MVDRRRMIGMVGVALVTACSPSRRRGLGAEDIDVEVSSTIRSMYRILPNTRDIARRAKGMLVIPPAAGRGLFGESARREGAMRQSSDRFRKTVQYYRFVSRPALVRLGRHRGSTVLFLMSSSALEKFRSGESWDFGAGIEVSVIDSDLKADINAASAQSPVLALQFDEDGILDGGAFDGARYTGFVPAE